jgi:ketosteroid isomerase-like protein
MRSSAGTWSEPWSSRIRTITEVGDRVIVEMINRGTGKASGVVVDGRFWFAYTVAEGKVVRLDAYLTKVQALRDG